MQLAKVSPHLPSSTTKSSPTSPCSQIHDGRVTASFAMLGDLNIGEPGALIGSPARASSSDHPPKTPEGFQRSEFPPRTRLLDAVVHRKDSSPLSQLSRYALELR